VFDLSFLALYLQSSSLSFPFQFPKFPRTLQLLLLLELLFLELCSLEALSYELAFLPCYPLALTLTSNCRARPKRWERFLKQR
jgi:hypothetical protein